MFGGNKQEDFKKELGCEYLLVSRPAYMAVFPDYIETGMCGFMGKLKVSSFERLRINYDDVALITLGYTLAMAEVQIEYKGKERVEAFIIEKEDKKKAEEIIEYVNGILKNMKSNEKNSNTSQIEGNVDIPEQIKKLSDLKDQGILTEDEFQIKKKDLLDKM